MANPKSTRPSSRTGSPLFAVSPNIPTSSQAFSSSHRISFPTTSCTNSIGLSTRSPFHTPSSGGSSLIWKDATSSIHSSPASIISELPTVAQQGGADEVVSEDGRRPLSDSPSSATTTISATTTAESNSSDLVASSKLKPEAEPFVFAPRAAPTRGTLPTSVPGAAVATPASTTSTSTTTTRSSSLSSVSSFRDGAGSSASSHAAGGDFVTSPSSLYVDPSRSYNPSAVDDMPSWSLDHKAARAAMDSTPKRRDEAPSYFSRTDDGRSGEGFHLKGDVRASLGEYAADGTRAWVPPAPPSSSSYQIPATRTQVPFPPTPPLSHSPQDQRSRTSSFGSNGYFGGAGSTFTSTSASTASGGGAEPGQVERSPTAAQLQAYFGPSSVEVIPPPGSDAFLPLLSPPPHSGLNLDPASIQMENEDLLYTNARATFVQQSLASLAPSCSPAQFSGHKQAMMAHFDRAMTTANPLATLYGLSNDDAAALAREPGKNGVSDVVLKMALLRMSQVRSGLIGGPLGGPSANNRKLGLYKTELCRSWEEKGNCRYGAKCQFAHGVSELREVARHPKFKSEVCRTFYLQGNCPYGRRCCFLHATVPTIQKSSMMSAGSDAITSALSGINLNGPSSSSNADSGAPPASRLAQRMSASSSSAALNVAALGRQTGAFGPALSDYLGPAITTSTTKTLTPPDSVPSSSQGSPVETFRTLDYGFASSSSASANGGGATNVFGAPFDKGSNSGAVGLGLRNTGRFTNNPMEVPAQHKQPPVSRLSRLTNATTSAPFSNANTTASFSYSNADHFSPQSFDSTFAPTPTQIERSGSTSSAAAAPGAVTGQAALLQPVQSGWLAGSPADFSLDWDDEDSLHGV